MKMTPRGREGGEQPPKGVENGVNEAYKACLASRDAYSTNGENESPLGTGVRACSRWRRSRRRCLTATFQEGRRGEGGRGEGALGAAVSHLIYEEHSHLRRRPRRRGPEDDEGGLFLAKKAVSSYYVRRQR